MTLDAPTCAALLRCSQSHLHRLAREGIVPATKVGRGLLFRYVGDNTLNAQRRIAPPKTIGRPRMRVV